jgi:hypothetical protein
MMIIDTIKCWVGGLGQLCLPPDNTMKRALLELHTADPHVADDEYGCCHVRLRLSHTAHVRAAVV